MEKQENKEPEVEQTEEPIQESVKEEKPVEEEKKENQSQTIVENNLDTELKQNPVEETEIPKKSEEVAPLTNVVLGKRRRSEFVSKEKSDTTESPTKFRKTGVDAKVVAGHYNDKRDKGLNHRTNSKIFYLRNFNNWIKSILIAWYLSEVGKERKPPTFALDLCCGKLGDNLKWKAGYVDHVVGADIALESLKDGLKRYNDRRLYKNFALTLIHADCANTDITGAFPDPNMYFHITSCQFALHYGFGSEIEARRLIKNAAERIIEGGYFVGTIPNASKLIENVKSNDGKTWKDPGGICEVTFENPITNLEENFGFGIKYTFSLTDAIDACPEYLINIEKFKQIGKEFGLELVELKPFSEFERKHKDEQRNIDLW
eukprot:CAMPEP_0206171662 /NCGR_PEP_ID=MMETSP1474-20131121/43169_1 /ASSEMBLY_ACC=CAM_ASM_001110 /TAXON_ID=97495 /ORGANISM="Imantonia sp., Strain RCC918" /LENGTH=373 /DNA_ID=CAMNT_0053579301 /DNA_START=23 /DNA_END=1141 /DNA_ORIENTATION=-